MQVHQTKNNFQVNNGIWSFLDYVEDIAAGPPVRLSSNL